MTRAVIALLFMASLATAADPRMLAAAYEIAGRVTASSEPWTPADFGTDMAMWLQSGETQKMAIVSGHVNRWTNSAASYASSVMVANSEFRRMTLTANVLAGYHAATSPNTNYSADAGAVWNGTNDLRNAPGYTSFVLMRPSRIPTGDGQLMTYSTAAAGTARFIPTLTANKSLRAYIRRADGDSPLTLSSPTNQASMATNAWMMFSAVADFPSQTATLYANGSGLVTNAGTLSAGALSSDTPSAAVTVLAQSDNTRGAFMEFIVLRKGATLAEIQKLEGWAAWRYSLTALLPADHPWKNSAPTK